jgi:hypothetical protein
MATFTMRDPLPAACFDSGQIVARLLVAGREGTTGRQIISSAAARPPAPEPTLLFCAEFF